MIRKPKRKIKKNPADDKYITQLKRVIEFGDALILTSTITYYKQGYECKDCGENYESCDCEGCDDCDFGRCLCDLNLSRKEWQNLEDHEFFIYSQKIRKIGWKLARLTLDKKQFVKLENAVIGEFSEEKFNDIKIPKIDKDWLKSR